MSGEDKSKRSEMTKPTLVGIPTLESTRSAPPAEFRDNPGDATEVNASTHVDVEALSDVAAEKVLRKAPTPSPPEVSRTRPVLTPRGVAPPPPRPSSSPSRSPRPYAVAEKPPMAPSGRATLNYEASGFSQPQPTGPARDPLLATGERPPIVVPAPGTSAPKAVTQPPPWGEDAVRLGLPGIPKNPPPADSVEELSGSVLLPDPSDPRATADMVEELSGSAFIDDGAPVAAPAAQKPASVATMLGHAPLSRPPLGKARSAPPPAVADPADIPPPDPDLPNFPFAAADLNAFPSAPPVGVAPDAAPMPAPDVAHPPTTPDLFGQSSPDESAGFPGPKPSAIDDLLPASLARGRRPVWFLPLVAACGGIVALGLVGLVIGLVKKGSSPRAPVSAATATGVSTTSSAPAVTSASFAVTSVAPAVSAPPTAAVSAATAVATAPKAPAVASTAACVLQGKSHVMAPAAVVSAGVEAVAWSGAVALGFASSEHEGVAVTLDPRTLTTGASSKSKSLDAVRRVTPLPSAGKLSVLVDADGKLDRVKARRRMLGDPPFDLGTSGKALVANGAAKLWDLEDGTAEALRAASLGDGAYAVAFRRAGAIWVGTVTMGKPPAAKGALARLAGAAMVGSPTIAASGGTVFVAWAERAGASDPWGLRTAVFKAGEAPGDTRPFTLPEGGLGEQASSPSVAGVPGGRFLLVWTEGPAAKKQVRAQTLSDAGASLGAPFTVSEGAAFAGQGQAAVAASGDGVVAYLSSDAGPTAKAFQVVAVPIACAP